MSRIYSTKSIDELEKLAGDESQRQSVLDELQFRRSRRARALVAKLSSVPSVAQQIVNSAITRVTPAVELVEAAEFLVECLGSHEASTTGSGIAELQPKLVELKQGTISTHNFATTVCQIMLARTAHAGATDRKIPDAKFEQKTVLRAVNLAHQFPTTWLAHTGTKPPPQPHPLWGVNSLERTAHRDPDAISAVFDEVEMENEVVRLIASLIGGHFSDRVCWQFVPEEFVARDVIFRAKRLHKSTTKR